MVSRDCDAICPADRIIVYALRKLGFKLIHSVEPKSEIRSSDFETLSQALVNQVVWLPKHFLTQTDQQGWIARQ